MLMQRTRIGKREQGFTLIELMIVVAIIGILAAIAVPNFISYRNKSRVAAGVGTAESIRAAIASFAADSADNLFPIAGSMDTYAKLSPIINRNGGSLKPGTTAMGIDVLGYTNWASDGGSVNDSYTLTLAILGVPSGLEGNVIQITPSGIVKCLSATTCP